MNNRGKIKKLITGKLRGIFKGNVFFKNTSLLIGGTVAGQAIVFASSPILTRLYTPDEFGILSVYAATLSFITIIATLRYELAIPLPKKTDHAKSLVKLSTISVFLFSITVLLLVILFGDNYAVLTNTVGSEYLYWLLPIGVFLTSMHKVYLYWAIRKKSFPLISKTRFQKGSGMALSQLTLGFFKTGYVGLIVGHIIGFSAGLYSLYKKWGEEKNKSDNVVINKSQIKNVASRYKKFPMFSTWANMANVVGTQFPALILATLYSPAVAGFYYFAHKIANAPVSLVAESIGKVFIKEAVDAKEKGSLKLLSENLFTFLLQISVGPLLLIAIFAPDIFPFIFGAEWEASGTYLQILMPWIISVFIFVPIFNLYNVLERQGVQLLFQICVLITIAGFFIGAKFDNPEISITIYSVSATVVYFCFGIWVLKQAGIYYQNSVLVVLKEIIYVTCILTPLLIVKLIYDNNIVDGYSYSVIIIYITVLIITILSLINRLVNSIKQIKEL